VIGELAGRARDWARLLKQGVRLAFDTPQLVPFGRVSPAKLLEARARERPSDLAIVFRESQSRESSPEEQRWSWADVDDRADRWAAWLWDRGVRAGSVVGLMMDNRPAFLFAAMGLSKIGATASFLNTNTTGKALVHAISACGARDVIVGSEHADAVLPCARAAGLAHVWIDREEGAPEVVSTDVVEEVRLGTRRRVEHAAKSGDRFCYIYTSGTTGLPKAAIVSNQRMIASGLVFGRLMHQCGPGDVIYVALPLYHTSAFCLGFGAALTTGAAIALRRKFSTSQFWDDVHDFRATSFVYIGEVCRYLLNAPPHPKERAHRLSVAVGNGLRSDVWERFQARFAIPVVREFYGSTEGSAAAINVEGKPGMIGRLAIGQAVVRYDAETSVVTRDASGRCVRVAPGEVGVLLGRISPIVAFEGYVDEKATKKKILEDVFEKGDRWFNSDDLVRLHPMRWLSFVDRLGDTFRWKGENVSTTEVAEVLSVAPSVLEATVYGVAIPGTEGRAGMAALRVDDGFDVDAFERHARGALASYQRPRFVRILPGEVRVTGTFKHQKEDYRREGWNPRVVTDALYVLLGDHYVRLDEALHARVERGDVVIA
jgi:fatty-acyl-CoA synthase